MPSIAMHQPSTGPIKPSLNALLDCGYTPTETNDGGVTTDKAFSVDRARFPFCHVLSAGEAAVYWTHDGYTRAQGEWVLSNDFKNNSKILHVHLMCCMVDRMVGSPLSLSGALPP
jgi:hypothetical protein